MNFLDIIILIPLVWFAYKGLSKGLISEIAQLVALIGGVFIAFNFSYFVGDYISHYLPIEEKYITIVAFIITFIGVIILVVFISKITQRLVEFISMGFLNKLGGLLFGALKIAFLLSCLFCVINKIDDNQILLKAETKNDSILYRPVSALAPLIIPKLKVSNFIIEKESEEVLFED